MNQSNGAYIPGDRGAARRYPLRPNEFHHWIREIHSFLLAAFPIVYSINLGQPIHGRLAIYYEALIEEPYLDSPLVAHLKDVSTDIDGIMLAGEQATYLAYLTTQNRELFEHNKRKEARREKWETLANQFRQENLNFVNYIIDHVLSCSDAVKERLENRPDWAPLIHCPSPNAFLILAFIKLHSYTKTPLLIKIDIQQQFHELDARTLHFSTYLHRLQQLMQDAVDFGEPITEALLDSKLRELLRFNPYYEVLEQDQATKRSIAGALYVPPTTADLFAQVLHWSSIELGQASIRGSTHGQPRQDNPTGQESLVRTWDSDRQPDHSRARQSHPQQPSTRSGKSDGDNLYDGDSGIEDNGQSRSPRRSSTTRGDNRGSSDPPSHSPPPDSGLRPDSNDFYHSGDSGNENYDYGDSDNEDDQLRRSPRASTTTRGDNRGSYAPPSRSPSPDSDPPSFLPPTPTVTASRSDSRDSTRPANGRNSYRPTGRDNFSPPPARRHYSPPPVHYECTDRAHPPDSRRARREAYQRRGGGQQDNQGRYPPSGGRPPPSYANHVQTGEVEEYFHSVNSVTISPTAPHLEYHPMCVNYPPTTVNLLYDEVRLPTHFDTEYHGVDTGAHQPLPSYYPFITDSNTLGASSSITDGCTAAEPVISTTTT